MKKSFLIVVCLAMHCLLAGQATNISGTINAVYTAVNSVNTVTNSANVASTAGLAVGDTVLIIQMQGATSNTSNSASFGDITAMNNAGKYEFAIICNIDAPGSNVVFQYELANSYDNNAGLQLIQVPTYTNAIVTNTLTAPAWDGTTGGVLVFQASGWVRLRTGNCVMMDQRGFPGGDHLIIGDPCGCGPSDPTYPDYFYSYNNNNGAPKGESISRFTTGREAGRGHQANGGGGGNDHNGGGGGGGNFGAGGNGGEPCATRSCFFFGEYCRGIFPGIGAAPLDSQYSLAENRIFMGGGGGAGDDNGGAGSGGAAGGGIVIILADSINGNGANIYARGVQAGTGAGDGVGGGGAGGSVLMAARSFHPSSPMIVHVNGGNGGRSSWSVTSSNHNSKGKGGGGGGGIFWISNGSVPGNITVNLNGGLAGFETAATACNGQTGGATDGGNGATLTNLVPVTGIVPFGTCVLPVEYAFVTAEPVGNMVRLDWETVSETDNQSFQIQRSADGLDFQSIGSVPGGNLNGDRYQFVDANPLPGINHYRLQQTDVNGATMYSRIMTVQMDLGSIALRNLFPNPVVGGEDLRLEMLIPEGQTAQLTVSNALGKQVLSRSLQGSSSLFQESIPTTGWATGVYFLKLQSGNAAPTIRRVLVAE